jgi:Flp pilus assembly protein TadG
MAIFALVSVLLFVVAGLAVDAGTSYLTSNQLERAAAAAALAGVAYLPGDQPDAINAALVEAARDGFTNAGTGGTSCAVNVSPCVIATFPQTNEMKVQISETVSTIFLRLVVSATTPWSAPRPPNTSRRSRSDSRAPSRDRR